MALLVVCALAFALLAVRELGGRRKRGRAGATQVSRARGIASAALRLGIPARLMRAGLADRVPVAVVLAAKAGGAAWGLAFGSAVASTAGGLGPILVLGLPIAGFLAPDVWLERVARRRRRAAVAGLPDALDLLAVGVASGRSPGLVLADVASAGAGALASELGIVVAEIECGASQREAIEALRDRLGGSELGALAAALERSRRFGSPLADQLHSLASTLRHHARRRIEERASRAAPKIQLVIALVLVPSVLLLLVAALVAHSGALLGG